MANDIDYPAVAVKNAIVAKFGAQIEPPELEAQTTGKVIAIRHAENAAEGTRDDLLAAVREASSFSNLWEVLARDGRVR